MIMKEYTSFDARETKFCTHEEFFSSAKLFDFPDDGRFLGNVVHTSYCCAETLSTSTDFDRDG